MHKAEAVFYSAFIVIFLVASIDEGINHHSWLIGIGYGMIYTTTAFIIGALPLALLIDKVIKIWNDWRSKR